MREAVLRARSLPPLAPPYGGFKPIPGPVWPRVGNLLLWL